MNRTALTFRSLLTDSIIVRSAMLLFAMLCVWFMLCGMYYPSIMFFGCCLAGIGYKARKFFASERRMLVPGMNHECAKVAIMVWFICSILSVALLHLQFNSFIPPEAIGGCVFALAFALWVGCIERTAIPSLILAYAIPTTLSLLHDEFEVFFNEYVAMPVAVHVAAGCVLMLLGIALVARFYLIVTSRHSPFVSRQTFEAAPAAKPRSENFVTWRHAIKISVFLLGAVWFFLTCWSTDSFLQKGKVDPIVNLSEILQFAAIAASIGAATYLVWSWALAYWFPSTLKIQDASHMIYGKTDPAGWRAFFRVFVLVLLLAMLLARIYIPQSDNTQSVKELIGFGVVMIPFIGGALLMFGLPNHFSRLWVSGAAESRQKTAMLILLVVASRSLLFQTLAIFCILSAVMTFSIDFLPFLFVSILAIGASAIPVWVIAKWFSFWEKHESFSVIVFLVVGATSMVAAIPNTGPALDFVDQMFESYSVLPCLVFAYLATTILWAICLFDAARSLGKSAKLAESHGQMFLHFTDAAG